MTERTDFIRSIFFLEGISCYAKSKRELSKRKEYKMKINAL